MLLAMQFDWCYRNRPRSRLRIRWLPRQKTAIAIYVLIVLLQCRTEEMSSLRVCDEVEKLGVSRCNGGTQGNLARISDGAGRQSAMHISIVGRVLVQIVAIQGAIVAALLFERVNYRRIALQQHAFAQAVLKHAGHKRPFIRL